MFDQNEQKIVKSTIRVDSLFSYLCIAVITISCALSYRVLLNFWSHLAARIFYYSFIRLIY